MYINTGPRSLLIIMIIYYYCVTADSTITSSKVQVFCLRSLLFRAGKLASRRSVLFRAGTWASRRSSIWRTLAEISTSPRHRYYPLNPVCVDWDRNPQHPAATQKIFIFKWILIWDQFRFSSRKHDLTYAAIYVKRCWKPMTVISVTQCERDKS